MKRCAGENLTIKGLAAGLEGKESEQTNSLKQTSS